jgi:oligosaccharide repeat unit polymerase
LPIKSIFKVIIFIIVALYSFYVVANFIGRGSSKSIVDYITAYMGGAIPCLDMFLKDKSTRAVFWGQESFYNLLQWLRRRGIVKIPYYSYHKEFRSIGNIGIGNVYTAFRAYYYDFGAIGMYFLHSMFSFVFSYIYEKGKKRVTNFRIIILGMLYNCVVFYWLNNIFFGTDCSFTFLIQALEVYVLYYVIIKHKLYRINISFKSK